MVISCDCFGQSILRHNVGICMKPEEVVGTWKLQSFKIIDKSNNIHDWGKNAHGILIYSADGYMSVSINSDIDTSEASDNLDKHILFYAGTYEIENEKIIHNVMNASDPNRIGRKLIREVACDNNAITLTAHGDYGSAVLKWEKISFEKSVQNSPTKSKSFLNH